MPELFKKPWFVLSSIIIITLSLVIIGTSRHVVHNPYQAGSFVDSPIVILCDDSSYSVEEVESALAWWEDLGYEFETIFTDFPCSDGLIDGAITITSADQDFPQGDPVVTTLAQTLTMFDEDSGYINNSRIQVLTKKPRVLEHELGHALGWEHFNENGHMMFPLLSFGGWDSSGLECQD